MHTFFKLFNSQMSCTLPYISYKKTLTNFQALNSNFIHYYLLSFSLTFYHSIWPKNATFNLTKPSQSFCCFCMLKAESQFESFLLTLAFHLIGRWQSNGVIKGGGICVRGICSVYDWCGPRKSVTTALAISITLFGSNGQEPRSECYANF